MKTNKENFYIKDKYDGQEYCISGEKHFYLINANDIVKDLLNSQRQEIIEKIEKLDLSKEIKEKDFSKLPDLRGIWYAGFSEAKKEILKIIKDV